RQSNPEASKITWLGNGCAAHKYIGGARHPGTEYNSDALPFFLEPRIEDVELGRRERHYERIRNGEGQIGDCVSDREIRRSVCRRMVGNICNSISDAGQSGLCRQERAAVEYLELDITIAGAGYG